MSIDYALRIYTDKLNSNSPVSVNSFKSQLTNEEFQEFKELIDFVTLLKSSSLTKEFNKVFDKIDEYKEKLYSEKMAVNFRAKNENITETIESKVDKIFAEEFKYE